MQAFNSISQTVTLINELKVLFAKDYHDIHKIQILIKDRAKTSRFFDKLLIVVQKCERKRGEKMDQQSNFLDQLKSFKSLIEENLKSPTKNHGILDVLDDHLSALRVDYKKIRDYVQTLEDVNVKIKKKLDKNKPGDQIARLIIHGIEKKIPKSIYLDEKGKESSSGDKALEVVKKFYQCFIQHVAFVRELIENNLDDKNYRLKLEDLQTKLIKKEPHDVNSYFEYLKDKIIGNRYTLK